MSSQSPYQLQMHNDKANKKGLSSFDISKNNLKRNTISSTFNSLSEQEKSLIFLQKTMGNQAVQRMIGAKRNNTNHV